MLSTGLKHHELRWHSNIVRSHFKRHKNHASNISYHFRFAVSFGSRASKMSEKIRLDDKHDKLEYLLNVKIRSTLNASILKIDSLFWSFNLRSIFYANDRFPM